MASSYLLFASDLNSKLGFKLAHRTSIIIISVMTKQLLFVALLLTLTHTQFSTIKDSVEITTAARCAYVRMSQDGQTMACSAFNNMMYIFTNTGYTFEVEQSFSLSCVASFSLSSDGRRISLTCPTFVQILDRNSTGQF